MDSESMVDIWNKMPERIIKAYYDLADKFVDKYKQKIASEFEWELEAIASTNNPRDLERLQERHAGTVEYLASVHFENDAFDYANQKVYFSDSELHDAWVAVPTEDVYEFLVGRGYDQKLQEAIDLLDRNQADLGEAKQMLDEHQGKRPSMLENVATLGRANRNWTSGQKSLAASVEAAEEKYWRQNDYVISRLSLADARDYGIAQVEMFHPRIAKIHHSNECWRIEQGTKNDPLRTYESEVKMYARECSRFLKHEISALEDALAKHETALEEHDKNKPGFIRNALSGGKLHSEWVDKLQTILVDITFTQYDLHTLEKRRVVNQRGDTPDAMAWARDKVGELYPDLAVAYESAIKQEWQANNQNRLERASLDAEVQIVDERSEEKGVTR